MHAKFCVSYTHNLRQRKKNFPSMELCLEYLDICPKDREIKITCRENGQIVFIAFFQNKREMARFQGEALERELTW